MLILFGIPLIAVLIEIIYGMTQNGDSFLEALFQGCLVGFLTFFICIFLIMGTSAVACSDETNKKVGTEETIEIVAIADGNHVSGALGFLGSGVIDDELKYTYMYSRNGYGLTIEQVPADNSYIIYTNTVPKVTKKTYTFAKQSTCLWALPMWDDEYFFELPENSVILDYRVDLQ